MARVRIDDHLEYDPDIHQFWVDGRPVPSFTQAMAAADLVNYDFVSSYYLERGSSVHKATHYFDENDLDPDYLESDQVGYLDAWAQACQDYGFKWSHIEAPVYSIPLQVAGIPDRRGNWNRDEHLVVVEIKTGQLYPATGVQLAFQQELSTPRPKHRIAIQLFPNGKYHPEIYKDRDDWKIAQSCLNICHWKRRNNK